MASSSGALDAFITFGSGTTGSGKVAPDIEGETTDTFEQDFKSSQISSYDMSFNLAASPGDEAGAQSGSTAYHAPTLGAVNVTKTLDMASTTTLGALVKAARYDDVWIWQKRSGGSRTRSGTYYWKIHLEDVMITDLNWSADQDGSVSEKLVLNYEKITAEYWGQKETGENDPNKYKKWVYPDDEDKAAAKHMQKTGNKNAAPLSSADTQRIVEEVLRQIERRGIGGGGDRSNARRGGH